MNRPNLDELARQLAASVPAGMRAAGEDMERNFHSLLQSAFSRMDLVTREEFDVQAAVLRRTREKVDALEAEVRALEAAVAGTGERPAATPGGPGPGPGHDTKNGS